MLNIFSCDTSEPTELALVRAEPTNRNPEFGVWQCLSLAPGLVVHPDQLQDRENDWLSSAASATEPCTVASLLAAARRWDLDDPIDLDAHDWWFRTTFTVPDAATDQPSRLCFDGLAGNADVWLNGRRLASIDNSFRSYRFDIAELLRTEHDAENELVISFRSLNEELKRKRPRPRWKTNLVRNQQLRWQRTSLIGRIPGWAPVAPAIGPWRGVRLETAPVVVEDLKLTSRMDGATGVVAVRARIAAASAPQHAVLRVGDVEFSLEIEPAGDDWLCDGILRLPNAARWWPHTHGTPTLHDCDLAITFEEETFSFPQNAIGFRSLEVRTDPGFALRINGETIYCRGGCWTIGDLLSPDTNEATIRRDLTLARDAGANMIRIGGTMQYESETFYRLCDELGLLVWQDFMFANMDYPVEDIAFRANITAEAEEQLVRLARHPSIAVYCGNSEIEQQAAMLGLARELWSNDWFARALPALCAEHHPGTTYLPSTPTGGVLPFHTHTGITHYYGVGAYLRPATDLRLADVKFTPECLGFANMPEPETMFVVTDGSLPVMHDPAWKRRVPRDGGAGWDFEDVRDHYLRESFHVDPAQLRSFDLPRYIALSRAVTGEMMSKAFAEWRSSRSNNAGGLLWFYKDLWPGAGWGVVDSFGVPKAAYYALKRTWQTRQLTVTDEGLNGLELHLTNETSSDCEATVELVLLKEPNVVVARAATTVKLAPRSRRRVSGDELLARFRDTNYAYRFGPPQHDVVVATWRDANHDVVSEAFHFGRRLAAGRATAQSVHAVATKLDDATYQVTLSTDRFLDTVRLAAAGYLPDDNYFHLVPDRKKVVTFRAIDAPAPFRPTLEALNFESDLVVPFAPANS